MPTIEFEIFCQTCGKNLEGYSKYTHGGIEVEPCPDCMDGKYDEGYQDRDEEKGAS